MKIEKFRVLPDPHKIYRCAIQLEHAHESPGGNMKFEYVCTWCGNAFYKTPEMQFQAFDLVTVPLLHNTCRCHRPNDTPPERTSDPELPEEA